jgi:hypothetical protein
MNTKTNTKPSIAQLSSDPTETAFDIKQDPEGYSRTRTTTRISFDNFRISNYDYLLLLKLLDLQKYLSKHKEPLRLHANYIENYTSAEPDEQQSSISLIDKEFADNHFNSDELNKRLYDSIDSCRKEFLNKDVFKHDKQQTNKRAITKRQHIKSPEIMFTFTSPNYTINNNVVKSVIGSSLETPEKYAESYSNLVNAVQPFAISIPAYIINNTPTDESIFYISMFLKIIMNREREYHKEIGTNTKSFIDTKSYITVLNVLKNISILGYFDIKLFTGLMKMASKGNVTSTSGYLYYYDHLKCFIHYHDGLIKPAFFIPVSLLNQFELDPVYKNAAVGVTSERALDAKDAKQYKQEYKHNIPYIANFLDSDIVTNFIAEYNTPGKLFECDSDYCPQYSIFLKPVNMVDLHSLLSKCDRTINMFTYLLRPEKEVITSAKKQESPTNKQQLQINKKPSTPVKSASNTKIDTKQPKEQDDRMETVVKIMQASKSTTKEVIKQNTQKTVDNSLDLSPRQNSWNKNKKEDTVSSLKNLMLLVFDELILPSSENREELLEFVSSLDDPEILRELVSVYFSDSNDYYRLSNNIDNVKSYSQKGK